MYYILNWSGSMNTALLLLCLSCAFLSKRRVVVSVGGWLEILIRGLNEPLSLPLSIILQKSNLRSGSKSILYYLGTFILQIF